MVEIFKTDIQTKSQSEMMLTILLDKFPSYQINFDLEDCDKILRIDTPTEITQSVIELMQNKGFNYEELTD